MSLLSRIFRRQKVAVPLSQLGRLANEHGYMLVRIADDKIIVNRTQAQQVFSSLKKFYLAAYQHGKLRQKVSVDTAVAKHHDKMKRIYKLKVAPK